MTTWADRVSRIKVGDLVAYGAAWLRSTGTCTGDLPQARGRVTALHVTPDYTIAEIAWDKPDLPNKVNVKNLCKVNSIGLDL